MRLQIFSDLHVDVAPPHPIAVAAGVDAVIVAGDVCQGAEPAFAWLRRIVPLQIPIVMTLGNHEFYRRCWPEEVAIARAQAPLYGVHLLEDAVVALGGARFIGATLWTDYALFGEHTVAHARRGADLLAKVDEKARAAVKERLRQNAQAAAFAYAAA